MALTTDTRIQKQTFSNRSYNDSGTCIRGMVNDLEAAALAGNPETTLDAAV